MAWRAQVIARDWRAQVFVRDWRAQVIVRAWRAQAIDCFVYPSLYVCSLIGKHFKNCCVWLVHDGYNKGLRQCLTWWLMTDKMTDSVQSSLKDGELFLGSVIDCNLRIGYENLCFKKLSLQMFVYFSDLWTKYHFKSQGLLATKRGHIKLPQIEWGCLLWIQIFEVLQ